ncbi:MAG: hypothetical protein ABI858_03880 [Pseudoxanthomonas sp.]
MSRTLSILGILLTPAYLVGLTLFFEARVAEIQDLKPNEAGDFLAGVFGPLAILWLILGFFQQGVELRQNTRALELQAEELRNSVEQQKHLVDVSRKQVEADLDVIRFERERQKEAAQPKFVFHGVGGSFSGSGGTYSSTVKNLGNTATEVVLSYDPPLKVATVKKVFSWSRSEEKRLEWEYQEGLASGTVILTISYFDASGLPGSQMFKIVPDFSRDHNMVEVFKHEG